jgi:surface protein
MKQKITLALATLMTLGMSSCSQDELLDSTKSTQAITFDVPFVSKSTRALLDNSNIAQQTLKVYGQQTPMGMTDWSTVFDGTELRQVNGRWTPSEPAFWYEYQDYRFVAVCPSEAPFSYNTTNGFVALTAVPVVQEAKAGTDYLVSNQYTTTTNSQDHQAVSFTMTHMLSKLTMGIMKTSGYGVRVNSSKLWMPKETITATYQADSAGIASEDTHCWAYSTFENGGTAPSGDYKSYPCFTDNLTLSAESANGTTYLVAPHADLNLYIDLDFDVLDANGKILRNKKIEKMPIKRNDMQLKSNTSYGITINIKADTYVDAIEFNEISVLDWDETQQTNPLVSNYVRFTSAGPVNFQIDGQVYNLDENTATLSLNSTPTTFRANYVEPATNKVKGGENFQTMDLSYLNLSQTTDWANMFNGCSSLEKVQNFMKWDNGQITRLAGMFSRCDSLKSIDDMSQLKTDSVTSLAGMFYRCRSLEKIGDLSNWNTSNVTNLTSMFNNCQRLESVGDLSGWKTDNVTNMHDMFYFCSSLKSVGDLSDWNTSNVTDMGWMFGLCSSLESIGDISNWNTANVTDLNCMFYHCNSLKEVNLHGWKTSNVTDLGNMFDMRDNRDTQLYDTWSKMERIDLGGWDTRKVMKFDYMFQWCDNLKELILDGWTISEAAVNTPSDDTTPSGVTGMFDSVNPTVKIYARGCDDYTIQTLRSIIPSEATLITE